MAPDYSSYEAYKATYRQSPRRVGGRPVKRRRRPWARLLALVAVLCAAALILRARMFVVREIEVEGALARTPAEVVNLSGLSLGMNIFRVDKERIESNLSSDGYIRRSEVEIQLPDTVRIRVEERTPRAAVNCAGVILLVDQEGWIMNRLNSMPQSGEIVVSGMDVSVNPQGNRIESRTTGQLQAMRRVLEAIEEARATSVISELNLSNLENLYLVSNTGVQVLLGDQENLAEKLVWTCAVLDELTKEGKMKGVLDVSTGKNAVYSEK